jgi:uncharacterized protein (TIGR03492 family)
VLMDTLAIGPYEAARRRRHSRAIAILPGSRASMVENFKLQLAALRLVPDIDAVDLFAVLPREADAALLRDASSLTQNAATDSDGDLGTLSDGPLTIHLSTGSLGAVLAASDLVLGQGGTANLQALGLGKPVVSFPTRGTTPRRLARNAAFAGDSRITVEPEPAELAAAMTGLLTDGADRLRRGAIGRERIGPPGAIDAIIAELAR